MSLLHTASFYISSQRTNQLPPESEPEICFLGRSNVGKSTAINIITNQKRLAFSSKTPGRTRLINMFSLKKNENIFGYLVDIPGYGYSTLSTKEQKDIGITITDYIKNRKSIESFVLLLDVRRGITSLDLQLINLINPLNKPLVILITKTDKLNYEKRIKTKNHIEKQLESFNNIKTIINFSAKQKTGVSELSDYIERLILFKKDRI
ncbi:GTP-binding protein engB [Candidatus Kinetoplastibacterium desouzaii TCC079E]|uniref:Probable GTP-binding protein EngB n=1 Tax=Candidatus Kinetoplastidibacterium desouzai TCC079E TaxID=1208919 RepID=M1M520_9PROT|nr:ribosome biogenesis GTP-binding protein YihA/YsxC [Candidatus Kinetoplastibacterium desouzaii]AGF47255.1 GTP-binding protein engB [Candidatus Kinetoplastibacterium desouzaii TCC079E]